MSCCYYLESSLPILQTSKQNQEDNIIEPQNIGNAGNPTAKLFQALVHRSSLQNVRGSKTRYMPQHWEDMTSLPQKDFLPILRLLNTETRIMFSNLTTPLNISAPYHLKPAQRPTRRFPVLTLLMRIVRSAALRI